MLSFQKKFFIAARLLDRVGMSTPWVVSSQQLPWSITKIIKKLEQNMYLPGSLEYLEKVGMDKYGRLNPDKKDLHTESNKTAIFKEYCQYYLDLE